MSEYELLSASDFFSAVPNYSIKKSLNLLHVYFLDKKKALATAESCTGGRLSSYIVEQENASAYFQGSIVSYSEAIKKHLLGVSTSALKEHGAVSHSVAYLMAKGVRAQMSSDWSLSVTGRASPSESGEVFYGLCGPNLARVLSSVLNHKTRVKNIEKACSEILSFLAHTLKQQKDQEV